MNRIRKTVIGAALAGSTLVGGAMGAALINGTSSAQSTATSTAPAATDQAQPPTGGQPHDPSQGGHVGANGVKEVLLTGDTADKVRAAAQAAVPGGTIQRVENDAEGSPYEAHATKSDGTRVTVKVDAAFKVTNVENDGGPR